MSDLQTLARDEWNGCARVIFSPEDLIQSGFSKEAVDACTEIMESNFSDPKRTVFDRCGKPVNQMRGVVFMDLAMHIAKAHKLNWETATGWNTTLDRIQEAIRGSAMQAGK